MKKEKKNQVGFVLILDMHRIGDPSGTEVSGMVMMVLERTSTYMT